MLCCAFFGRAWLCLVVLGFRARLVVRFFGRAGLCVVVRFSVLLCCSWLCGILRFFGCAWLRLVVLCCAWLCVFRLFLVGRGWAVFRPRLVAPGCSALCLVVRFFVSLGCAWLCVFRLCWVVRFFGRACLCLVVQGCAVFRSRLVVPGCAVLCVVPRFSAVRFFGRAVLRLFLDVLDFSWLWGFSVALGCAWLFRVVLCCAVFRSCLVEPGFDGV